MEMATIYKSKRSELKEELYRLLAIAQDSNYGPASGESDDFLEKEGLSDLDLADLIESYRAEFAGELQMYSRVFPMLASDLMSVAKKNHQVRGVLGFYDSDLSCQVNAGLGFCMYQLTSIHHLCRLLGWTTKQVVQDCPDCDTPSIATLWMPPSP